MRSEVHFDQVPQLKFASLPKAKTRRSYFFFARVGGGGHFPGGSAGETSAYNARDIGWISALGRCSGGGHGNPPQYSCLENPMDRGAWQATVHGVVFIEVRNLSRYEGQLRNVN